MKNSSQTPQQANLANWGLVGIGTLLLVFAIFFDPIGASPDTGMFDLGTTGTSMLLGVTGILFLLAGIWNILKNIFGKSK